MLEQAKLFTKMPCPEGDLINTYKLRSYKPDVLEAIKESP